MCIYNFYILFTAFSIYSCLAFNLEPRLPVVKYGPRNSYFGYSVAEHLILQPKSTEVVESVMLVGAPRAQSGQPGTNHSGLVFKCQMTTHRRDCTPLRIDQDDRAPLDSVSKDDQWMGVTVKSQGPGGRVMACAHRYVLKGHNTRWGQGICYSLTSYLDYGNAWEPCKNRAVQKAHEEFGYCQAGTSGDISEDNDIIIGTPGPYTWKGTIFTNSIRFDIGDDKTWYYGPLLDNSPVDKYSYLGMSATSGRFFGTATSYASGAPRSNGTGQVVFFTKEKGNRSLIPKLILSGEQFASSFGYTVASIDCNNDQRVDIVVGAPFYYSETEGGAVYVYLNRDHSFSLSYSLKLTGKPESRFGFALANLGDINKDKYNDLAIGAPYEEPGGAVYIYLGSKDGIKSQPSQIIRASDLPSDAKVPSTFGYSLSGAQDLDGNGYPDLLVGAYDSDAIILLRARPILNITTTVTGDLTNIKPNEAGCPQDSDSKLPCFHFRACFQFNSNQPMPSTKLRYRIEAETFTGKPYSRVKFRSSQDTDVPNVVQRNISLTSQHCSEELVYITDKSDIQSPIKFLMTYSLLLGDMRMGRDGEPLPLIDAFPILNQEEARKTFEARFHKNCGLNDICESQLEVSAEMHLPEENKSYVLYLGAKHVNITLRIANRNEPAYDAYVNIIHPEALSYVKGDHQGKCNPQNSSLVHCDLGNPFNQEEVELNLVFRPNETLGEKSEFDITIQANTTSQDISPQNNRVVLKTKVITKADLELKGFADTQNVLYGGKVVGQSAIRKETEIGSLVTQSYVVINHGPSRAKRVEVKIQWPHQVESGREEGKWLLYLMEKPTVQDEGYCEIDAKYINPAKIKPVAEGEPTSSDITAETKSRRKRDTVIPISEYKEDGKTHNVVIFDCAVKTAKCIEFSCFVFNLRAERSSVIKIRSRLWNSTLVEDYSHGVNQVHIISHASLKLDALSGIDERPQNDFASARTKVYPDLPLLPPQEAPFWVILLAVILGILILLLVIFILWKCGFFKRQKPVKGYVPADTDDKDYSGYN